MKTQKTKTHQPDFIVNTHYACREQLQKFGGKTPCCGCFPHEGCDITTNNLTPKQKLIKKAVKRAVVEYGDALKKLGEEE